MSDKHKRELKRQQKKKEEAKRQQRLDRITPDVRESDIECWLVDEWEKEGWYDLHCLRRLPSGRFVIGVIGVNDGLPATGESELVKDADPAGFRNKFIPDMKEKYDTRKVTLKEARDLVCGAVEWNKKHGLRIPADFAEVAAVVGSLDEAIPDYTGFGSAFTGTYSQLANSLAPGVTIAQAIRRADVEFDFDITAYEDFEHEDDASSIAQWVHEEWRRQPATIVLPGSEADAMLRAKVYVEATVRGRVTQERVASTPTRAPETQKLNQLLWLPFELARPWRDDLATLLKCIEGNVMPDLRRALDAYADERVDALHKHISEEFEAWLSEPASEEPRA